MFNSVPIKIIHEYNDLDILKKNEYDYFFLSFVLLILCTLYYEKHFLTFPKKKDDLVKTRSPLISLYSLIFG